VIFGGISLVLCAALLSGCAIPTPVDRVYREISDVGLREGKVVTSAGTYEVKWNGRSQFELGDFDRVVSADRLSENDYPAWVTREGIGEPAILYRSRKDDDFVSALGTALAVTVVKEGNAMTICDVLDDDSYGGKALAASFSAPLAYLRKQGDLKLPVVKAMLRSGKYLEDAGLYRFEPVDTNLIPVIFVHGLKSSPSIWKNMVGELRGDEVVRKNFQFWSFSYPTGIPVTYAAKLLRDDLKKAHALYSPGGRNLAWNKMVIVGHSMGGLVSRLQVTDSGTAFWDSILIGMDHLKMSPEIEAKARDALIFGALPFIDRAVFIATPHGGSHVAVSGFGGMVSKLIHVPGVLKDAVLDTLSLNPDVLAQMGGRMKYLPTSIDNLDPESPFIQALKTRPIPRRVPFHSIIACGQDTIGPVDIMNDGLVSYYSASLEGAISEKIVTGGHRAPNNKSAIDEMARILRLHLKENR
jgi:hypothetical protein